MIGLTEDKTHSIWIDRMARLIGYAFIIGVTPEVEAAINELLDAQKAALPPATEAPAA